MTRERTEGGHYAREYTSEDVLDVFSESAVPVLTSPEVADFLGCSSETARQRLEALVDDQRLVRKEVGARAVVYIRLQTDGNRESGYGEWKQSLWSE